jgi:hypothetical protein
MRLHRLPLTLFRTVTDPSVYKEILTKTFKSSLSYFLITYALVSLIIAAVITTVYAPRLFPPLLANLEHLRAAFPQDTVLNVTPQELSVTGTSPVVISLKESLPANTTRNLLVINPQLIAEDINHQDTLVLLTSQALAISYPPEAPTIFTWNELDTHTTITAADFTANINQTIQTMMKIRTFLFPLSFFAVFTGFSLSRFLIALIYTLVTSAAGSLTGRPYPYKNYLNISLHISIIAEIITLFQTLIYSQTFPNFYLIIFFGVSLIAIYSLPKPTILRLKKS